MASSQQYRMMDEHEVRGLVMDPAYMWRWALVLPDLKGTVQETMSASSNGGAMQSPGQEYTPDIPIGLALSVNFPPEDLGIESRTGGATNIQLPRHQMTGTVPITFYEDYTYKTTKYLQAWKREIVDADRKGLNHFGLPSDYKKQILFFGFDITSNTRSIIQVVGTDCFPTPPGGLDYGVENGILTVSTDFSVDSLAYSFTRVPQQNPE